MKFCGCYSASGIPSVIPSILLLFACYFFLIPRLRFPFSIHNSIFVLLFMSNHILCRIDNGISWKNLHSIQFYAWNWHSAYYWKWNSMWNSHYSAISYTESHIPIHIYFIDIISIKILNLIFFFPEWILQSMKFWECHSVSGIPSVIPSILLLFDCYFFLIPQLRFPFSILNSIFVLLFMSIHISCRIDNGISWKNLHSIQFYAWNWHSVYYWKCKTSIVLQFHTLKKIVSKTNYFVL